MVNQEIQDLWDHLEGREILETLGLLEWTVKIAWCLGLLDRLDPQEMME